MNTGNIFTEDESKQVKSTTDFKNLKSDYFLIKLFDIMKRNKSLEIVKYNKQLQNRLNLSVNDYKEFSQLYSSILIELKPAEKKKKFNKFINIPNEVKKYYHIYFDDSNLEIRGNCFYDWEKINKIKIIIEHQVKSFKGLFGSCECIGSIFFKKFNRINITDMSWMFSGCLSLKKLNLSNFNTNNVSDMSGMFNGCTSLEELNLSNFNTNNVTDMSYMFSGCSLFKRIKSF